MSAQSQAVAALEQELADLLDEHPDRLGSQRSSVRCMLVIPADGAVYRPNVKRDDNRLKDIQIKKARFVGGAGQPGMRFAVGSKQHVVLSETFECSAVSAGC